MLLINNPLHTLDKFYYPFIFYEDKETLMNIMTYL